MTYIIVLILLGCVHVHRVSAVKWLQPRPTTPHAFPKRLNHVAQQTQIELRQRRERVRTVLLHTFKITHNYHFSKNLLLTRPRNATELGKIYLIWQI